MKKIILFLIFLLVLNIAFAGVTNDISTSIRIWNSSGGLLDSDSIHINLSIFDASSGGNLLVSQINTTNIDNGTLHIRLNNINESFDMPYWLNIAIDNHSLPGRVKFTSSPTTMRANFSYLANETTYFNGSLASEYVTKTWLPTLGYYFSDANISGLGYVKNTHLDANITVTNTNIVNNFTKALTYIDDNVTGLDSDITNNFTSATSYADTRITNNVTGLDSNILNNRTAIELFLNTRITNNYTASIGYVDTHITTNVTGLDSDISNNITMLIGNIDTNYTKTISYTDTHIIANTTKTDSDISNNVTMLIGNIGDNYTASTSYTDTHIIANTTKTNSDISNNVTMLIGNIGDNYTASTSYTDTRINNNKTLFDTLYVLAADWTSIDNYPTGCTNQFVTTITDTLTCASVDSAYIATDAVKDDEVDYSAVTLSDFTDDVGFLTNNTDAILNNLTIIQNITLGTHKIFYNGSGLVIQ